MATKNACYRINVTLREIEPLIWRRIEVPASYSFWDLHVAVQDAMGWLDCHLHVFRVANPNTGELEDIGIPGLELFEDDRRCEDGWEVPIAQRLTKPGDRAEYEYDFGDGWQHALVLEEIVERAPRTKYPRCVDGARACPPEDCGGPHGYENLLRVLGDPLNEEHESMREWLGDGYDPAAFNPRDVRFEDPKRRRKLAFGR